MTAPFELLAQRLAPYKVRENGPGRLRACCPVCGETNNNTLSVGEAANGAALVKCFKSGCSIEAITAAVGITVSDLFPPKTTPGGGSSPIRRRRLLTAYQAIDLLHEECLLIVVTALDVAPFVLDEDERERLLKAAARVVALREEVRA